MPHLLSRSTYQGAEVELDWDWHPVFRPSSDDFTSPPIAHHLVARAISERQSAVRAPASNNKKNWRAVWFLAICLALFCCGSRCDAAPPIQEPPLLIKAVTSGDVSAAEALLRKGANVDVRYGDHTSLTLVCGFETNERTAVALVQLLLKYHADVNAHTDLNSTALIYACGACHFQVPAVQAESIPVKTSPGRS